jgi:hypothetical protein
MLAQIVGAGVMAPLNLFIHYICSPIELFKATDRRMTRMRYTPLIGPVILAVYLLPFYGMYFHPDLDLRQTFLFLWQLYPVGIAVALFALARLRADTNEFDKVHVPLRDLPYVRTTVGAASLIAAGGWVANWATSPFSLPEAWLPSALPASTADLTAFTGQFLRWDGCSFFGSHIVWLLLLFGDMRAAGMIAVGPWRMALYAAAGTIALGPGATVGLLWLWREEILATRRHKDAVTEQSVARLHAPGIMNGKA